MITNTLASITLIGIEPILSRFFVQAQLPHEVLAHPYGQWSLAITPIRVVNSRVLAFVEFVAPDAPHSFLNNGVELQLYRGITHVGFATICDVMPEIEATNVIDEYIWDIQCHVDPDVNAYAQWFLMHLRLPACKQVDWLQFIEGHQLLCTYEGKRYQIVSASRFGTVGLTENLECKFPFDNPSKHVSFMSVTDISRR